MVAAYRYLKGTRNRPVLPHRLCSSMRDTLALFAELARSVGTQLDGDPRWLDAATALDAAAESLRRVAE